MDPGSSALLTDLYQLNMVEAYLANGETAPATFELIVRKLPAQRNFLMAAGLEQALAFLEDLHFTRDDIDWLRSTERFSARALDYLASLRFSGSVHAMPEGTAFFANEPILRLTAPLPEAQLVESRLINIVNFQTLVASKAARCVLAASGKPLVDFGLRRAHGAEAGLLAARASYIAGFAGTATVLAGKLVGIPLFGTMAHSYIQAHDDEATAFERFARARPQGLVLLLDTYDTERAARKLVALASRLARDGIRIASVRLDSGDLHALSRSVRHILDAGGLGNVTIFASGGLAEDQVAALIAAGAPIDGFGIGTSVAASADAPTLDIVYKLQDYAGRPRRKHSPGKETWPGRKQVWRRFDASGTMAGDTISLADANEPGTPLLVEMMRSGKRSGEAPTIAAIRAHAAHELAALPEPLRALAQTAPYPVKIGAPLRALAASFDRSLEETGGS
jgi:nicotinate phosphoribosyltransferase